LLDFWNHQECKPSLDDSANAQLANMPVVPGGANCFHLLELAGGRVCVVHSVKGTNLLNNPKVIVDLFMEHRWRHKGSSSCSELGNSMWFDCWCRQIAAATAAAKQVKDFLR
jgi:hypothetical protein